MLKIDSSILTLLLVGACTYDEPPTAAPRASGSAAQIEQNARSSPAAPGSGGWAPQASIRRSADAGTSSRPALPASGSNAQGGGPLTIEQASDSGSAEVDDPAHEVHGSDVKCVAGDYAGALNGTLQFAEFPVGTVTGTIRLRLVAATNADAGTLHIHNGRIDGIDQYQNKFSASVNGTLNCLSREIEDGTVEDGTYHIAEPQTDVVFRGEAHGTYSDDASTALGTWSVVDGAQLLKGLGTWNVINLQAR